MTTRPAGSVSRFQMQASTGNQGKQTEGMAMHVKVELAEAAGVSYARQTISACRRSPSLPRSEATPALTARSGVGRHSTVAEGPRIPREQWREGCGR